MHQALFVDELLTHISSYCFVVPGSHMAIGLVIFRTELLLFVVVVVVDA